MEANGPKRELLSVNQAARQLGLSPRRLREAVRSGELPAYRPGDRTVYLRWSELLRWLCTQRVRSSDHARDRAAEIIAEEARMTTAAG